MAFLGLFYKEPKSIDVENRCICYVNSSYLQRICMKKNLIFFWLLSTPLCAAMPQMQGPSLFQQQHQQEPQLTIHNAILAKVNGNTISVLDVMKKMDLIFHRAYPQFIDNKAARYQFYVASWERVLNDMVNTELMLADAKDKEIKLSDGEVREEMETRFGPNIMFTLDQIGITFDEAWKLTKNEMFVTRMTWFFANSKALHAVTPETIRLAYREHCQQNPASDQWNYQVITIRSDQNEQGEELAQKAYNALAQKPDDLRATLQDLPNLAKLFPSSSIQISPEYRAEAKDLSESHLAVLESLSENSFSKPVIQKSRFENKDIHRIFYLKSHEKEKGPAFDDLSVKLKDDLLQKASETELNTYLEKLRRFYSHGQPLVEKLPENFQPFVIN